MDHKLNEFIDELKIAIRESVSASEEIADCVERIKKDGYDVVLVVNATIAVKEHRGRLESLLQRTKGSEDCDFSTQDVRFLKELHIKVNG